MNILVIGAGAIGGYLGGRLADQHNVTLVGRPRLVNAIKTHGMLIIEPEAEYPVRRISALDSIEAAFQNEARFDLALFCVKTYDTLEAIDLLRTFAHRIDRILSLQNGVASEDVLGEAFGREKIIAGTILNPISIPEPGLVRLEKRKGGIGLAAVGASSIDPIVTALKSIGLPLRVYADYRSMKWSKLLLNLIGNATSAILDMTTRETFADRRIFKIEIAALRETLQVMAALSIKPVALPGYPVPLLVFALRRLPLPLLQQVMRPLAASGRGDKQPSLLMDLASGKTQSEIEELNGAIVRTGKSIGVKTPVNAALTEILAGLIAGRTDRNDWRRQVDKLARSIDN
jgi:2-dehydropantoate 2-reductase